MARFDFDSPGHLYESLLLMMTLPGGSKAAALEVIRQRDVRRDATALARRGLVSEHPPPAGGGEG